MTFYLNVGEVIVSDQDNLVKDLQGPVKQNERNVIQEQNNDKYHFPPHKSSLHKHLKAWQRIISFWKLTDKECNLMVVLQLSLVYNSLLLNNSS